MKKLIQKLAFGLLLATGLTTSTFAQGQIWQNIGTAGFSGGFADYTSLVFNAAGEPYVAFKDAAVLNRGRLMKFDGTNWVNIGPGGFSTGSAEYTSLAFNTAGEPYVAFRDGANGDKASVMKFDGTNWVNVGTAGFSAAGAYFTSLAFSPSGEPYVAFQDNGSTPAGKATVMKFDGTNWVNVGTAGFSTGIAQFTSLAFSATGEPYVAFRDVGNSSKATVMKFDGTNWINIGTAGFSTGVVRSTCLVFNAAGVPYVAFTDDGNAGKGRLMKFDGSNWVNVGTTVFSAGQAEYTSLAFNTAGEPCVAYTDGANSAKATVMKFDGSNWVNLGTAGFSAGQANYTSLAFNAAGEPYVAFKDYGNSQKTTVMKFGAITQYTVTTTANPTAGGTTSGDGIYQATDNLSAIDAVPQAGYGFIKWTLNGGPITVMSNDFNLTAQDFATQYGITDGNIHLTGHFTDVQHTITATPFPAGAGTITGGGTYFEGQMASHTATANSGYFFTSTWIAPNGSILGTNNSYNVVVNADKEIIGLFGKTGEAVVYTSTFGGGTTSGSGVYPLNQLVTITATPSSGYAFVQWQIDGYGGNPPILVSTNSTHTFTPTAQIVMNLRAVFSNTQYTITTSATPSIGGTTSGGGTYLEGTSVTVTATANAGYHFVRWTASGGAEVSTNNNFTFNVSNNLTLTAEFEVNPAGTYTVSTSANPIIGGTTTGDGAFTNGTSVTVIATPNTGYQFVKWTEGGADVSIGNSYTFTANADRALVAQFEESVGVNDIASNTITAIYPNPANTVLNIEVKENTSIKIVDVVGKIVATQSLNTGKNEINVSSFTNGVYFIHSENTTVKFIKN